LGPVVGDLQLERVVKPPLKLLRNPGQVNRQHRQCVEERGVAAGGRGGGGGELRQALGERSVFPDEGGVLGADAVAEGALLVRAEVGRAVFVVAGAFGEGLDQAALPSFQGGEVLLQLCALVSGALLPVLCR
jgi:hypothetical protein